jgi:hypothetical protein
VTFLLSGRCLFCRQINVWGKSGKRAIQSFSDPGMRPIVYSTNDLSLFQEAQIGSEWTLNINTFGNLVSIEN